jgi:ferric-dicitrate binding protein FerR (iron transport regulator)
MARKTKQSKSVLPYIQGMARDEYVQEQLRHAASRLREAYGRARRQGGDAAEDKKLYANLGEAAASIRKAASRLQRKPEPKRRGRKIAVAAAAGGAGVLLIRRRKAKSDGSPDLGVPLDDSGAASPEIGPEGAGGSAGN